MTMESALATGSERITARRVFTQAVVLMALVFSSLGGYLAVLNWRGRYATIATRLAWDSWVPFWPSWVWVYLLPYLLGPAIAGALSRPTFVWLIRRGLLVTFVSLTIFIVVPTRTVRPAESLVQAVPESFTKQIYTNMAETDTGGGNAAPSLHVSLTCLLAMALIRDYRRLWPLWLGLTGLVWLATLFTWQHHLLDVVTGALLACLCALPWPFRRREMPAKSAPPA